MRSSFFLGSAAIPSLLLVAGCSAILGLDPVELQSVGDPDAASSSGDSPPDGLDAQASGDAAPDGASPGVDDLTGPTIAIGAEHACAITAERQVKCWGKGEAAGGDTSNTSVTVPTAIAIGQGLLDHVIAIAAGHISTCALRDEAPHMMCWGRLPGSEQVSRWATPVDLEEVKGGVAQSGRGLVAFSHAKAENAFGCVVSAGRRGYCRGANTEGQLGTQTGVGTGFQVVVDGVSPLSLSQIATGEKFACARTDVQDGHGAACWGLVPGLPDDSLSPIRHVPEGSSRLLDVRRVAVGDQHACAITGGPTYCWGASGGRLGRGEAGTDGNGSGVSPPGAVIDTDGALLTRVLDVAAGTSHTCFLVAENAGSTSGIVRCSGAAAQGQVGVLRADYNGDPDEPLPAPAVQRYLGGTATEPLSGVREVVAGRNTSCARTEDGKVYCWGARYVPSEQGVALHWALDMGI